LRTVPWKGSFHDIGETLSFARFPISKSMDHGHGELRNIMNNRWTGAKI